MQTPREDPWFVERQNPSHSEVEGNIEQFLAAHVESESYIRISRRLEKVDL